MIIFETSDYSSLLITLFSMTFTIVSTLMSMFEYFLSSKFVSFASNVIVTFHIQCAHISQMKNKKFRKKVIFKRGSKLTAEISKILKLSKKQIERLNPKQDTRGAIFTFAIAIDESKKGEIEQLMTQCINNGELAKVFKQLFKVNEVNIDINTLSVVRLDDLYSQSIHQETVQSKSPTTAMTTLRTENH